MTAPGDVTRLLAQAADGNRGALEQVFPLVYEQLLHLAQRQLRREREDHTLDTVALVHEAYLKLTGLDHMPWQNRAHFLAVAAQAMRRVLVNYALSRKTHKRGGGWRRVPLEESQLAADLRTEELLALDRALERLAALNERQCRVVECRFFAGMEIDETAQALGISPVTVKRDWTVARAFLNRELGES